MTIKELYNWAKKNNYENLPIGLQYQDGGGEYNGNTFAHGDDASADLKETSFGEKYILLY